MTESGTVVVVGATSAMGRAFAQALAREGHGLVLVGRSEEELERIARDLGARFGVAAEFAVYDACEVGASESLLAGICENRSNGISGLVLCHGTMPDESEAREDVVLREATMRVNYASAVELIEAAVPKLSSAGSPFVIGVTSVAGDRGRPSNALYGSTKAALGVYLSGLRSRLSREGVRVITVKPGFVDTRMTWGLSGLFLVAPPEKVAADGLKGLKKNRAVVYSPGFWRLIMWVIKMLPDVIFRRLQF